MTSQEVTLPFDIGKTSQVIKLLETENKALSAEDYELTTQKVQSVEKCFEIADDGSIGKNYPRKRTHDFFEKALARSEKLFLLSALAGHGSLISTFSELKTELDIKTVLEWWDKVESAPRLENLRATFSFKFRGRPASGEKTFTSNHNQQLT
jgi:hypothetical protein